MTLEELDCIDVEVVGRLVHDEELGLACQHLGESDTLYLATGKFLHLLVRIVEVEVGQELDYPVLILPKMLLVKVLGELDARRHHLLEDAFFRVERVVLLKECDLDVLEEHDLSA